eukprot:684172-Prorocentrum_minimum.AAC.2
MDQPGTDWESLLLHEELLNEVPDGFVIYSTDYLGTIRPINRLVKFAAGETVLVVPSGDLAGSVRAGWLEAATHAMVLNQVRPIGALSSSVHMAYKVPDWFRLSYGQYAHLRQPPLIITRSHFHVHRKNNRTILLEHYPSTHVTGCSVGIFPLPSRDMCPRADHTCSLDAASGGDRSKRPRRLLGVGHDGVQTRPGREHPIDAAAVRSGLACTPCDAVCIFVLPLKQNPIRIPFTMALSIAHCTSHPRRPLLIKTCFTGIILKTYPSMHCDWLPCGVYTHVCTVIGSRAGYIPMSAEFCAF